MERGWGLCQKKEEEGCWADSGLRPRPRTAAAMGTSEALGPCREPLCGLVALECFLSLWEEVRAASPSPTPVRVLVFLGTWNLPNLKKPAVTCTCRIFKQFTTVHAEKHTTL